MLLAEYAESLIISLFLNVQKAQIEEFSLKTTSNKNSPTEVCLTNNLP